MRKRGATADVQSDGGAKRRRLRTLQTHVMRRRISFQGGTNLDHSATVTTELLALK